MRAESLYNPPIEIPFGVENPWFTGEAAIPTFSREEMLATKLRALLQRNKGRDLFDLDYALTVFEGLNTARHVPETRQSDLLHRHAPAVPDRSGQDTDRPDTRRRMDKGWGNAGTVWSLAILERLLPLCGPQDSRLFALSANQTNAPEKLKLQ